MLFDLERLDTRAILVLFVDDLAEVFDHLIGDVVDVAAAFCRRYRVDERDLLEARVRARDCYLPALVRLLVHELDWLVELVRVARHVQPAVVFEFSHWNSIVVEIDLKIGK